jgi:hypothetical protein
MPCHSHKKQRTKETKLVEFCKIPLLAQAMLWCLMYCDCSFLPLPRYFDLRRLGRVLMALERKMKHEDEDGDVDSGSMPPYYRESADLGWSSSWFWSWSWEEWRLENGDWLT